jgi:hypothetical protein
VVEDGAVLDRAGGQGGGGLSSGRGGARPGAVENGVAAGVVLDRGQWGPGRRMSSIGGSSGDGSENLWAWGTVGVGACGELSVQNTVGPRPGR